MQLKVDRTFPSGIKCEGKEGINNNAMTLCYWSQFYCTKVAIILEVIDKKIKLPTYTRTRINSKGQVVKERVLLFLNQNTEKQELENPVMGIVHDSLVYMRIFDKGAVHHVTDYEKARAQIQKYSSKCQARGYYSLAVSLESAFINKAKRACDIKVAPFKEIKIPPKVK